MTWCPKRACWMTEAITGGSGMQLKPSGMANAISCTWNLDDLRSSIGLDMNVEQISLALQSVSCDGSLAALTPASTSQSMQVRNDSRIIRYGPEKIG